MITTPPQPETTPPDSASPNPLLEKIVAGSLGPLTRLQDTINLTLVQISDWIAQPHNRQQLSNLVTLLDAQTQLMICQHRLIAVAKLADVAMNAPSHETVRRACSDLLKIRLIEPYRENKRPEPPPPPEPPRPKEDPQEWLDFLEKIGTENSPHAPGAKIVFTNNRPPPDHYPADNGSVPRGEAERR